MSIHHYNFTIAETPQKNIKYKILNPTDGSLLYYLKQRKQKSITPFKSEFYIMDSAHNYISSIYPLEKSDSFSGAFELSNGGTYIFDYKKVQFNLSIDGETITFYKGQK